MVLKATFTLIFIRASLGSEIMSEKQKPNDLFDAPNMLLVKKT